jgi:hypothetical protein
MRDALSKPFPGSFCGDISLFHFHRCIGGSTLMVNTVSLAPGLCGFRNKFAIISNEDMESVARLDSDSFVPSLESQASIAF